MKDSAESSHRRLIRPSLGEVKEQMSRQKRPPRPRREKRSVPPDETHAESYYYVKQMQNRTPMVLVLRDGEQLSGTIEWYDRACLKLSRPEGPNLLVYKDGIKYLYKQEEAESGRSEDASEPDPDDASGDEDVTGNIGNAIGGGATNGQAQTP